MTEIQMLQSNCLTKEESYAQRRQLFRDIWETAMHIDEKEDILNKPKVIKTLRMDEIDKCPVGKSKKQRIKNLRHVCRRILDFCDRQEAEITACEQVKSLLEKPTEIVFQKGSKLKIAEPDIRKPRKLKKLKRKRKLTKTESLLATHKDVKMPPHKSISDREKISDSHTSDQDPTSHTSRKRKVTGRRLVKNKAKTSKTLDIPKEFTVTRKKVLKKTRIKKKKTSTASRPIPQIISV